MKKALIGLTVLALTLVFCGSASAALHDPIAVGSCSPSGVPADYTYAELPVFLQGTGNPADAPVTAWPTVYDFCGMLDQTSCSINAVTALGIDLGDMAALIPMLACINADINGTLNMALPIPVQPNGMPDGQYELGILGEALNNPANPYHAEALAAFQGNFQQLKNLIATALVSEGYWGYTSLIPDLVGSLAGALAGYAALGDPTTTTMLDALLGLLSGIGVVPPAGGIAAITTSVPKLGQSQDADGDGASNKAEYNYFKANGPAATIAAIFDKNQTPPPTTPRVVIAGAGTYEEFWALELKATALNCSALTYQWSKNGTPLASETASSFSIPVLAMSDSGKYSCSITYDDAAKAIVSVDSPEVKVTVVLANSLPIAGGLGLALLAGACALGGVGSIRRRK